MIPRQEAKALIDEYLSRLRAQEEDTDEAADEETLHGLRDELLQKSILVLRGSENVEQKGRRYLVEGRLEVEMVNPATGFVQATCRGSEGVYKLGHDPRRNQWRCTCGPAGRKGRCSHVIALRLVATGSAVRTPE